jgi:hypothetical protein
VNYAQIDELQILESDIYDIYHVLSSQIINKDTALRHLARDCDRKLGLSGGVSLTAAWHFIATRRWIVNLNLALSPSHILDVQHVQQDCKEQYDANYK